MLPARQSANLSADNLATEETKMRQALGLRDGGGTSARPAPKRDHEHRGRRFVKDGEVPVVVVQGARESTPDGAPPANRLAAAESALRSERAAREQAEKSLHDAHATIQSLRTQLAHAEMAHVDALKAERQAREAAEAAVRDITAEKVILEQQIEDLSEPQVRAPERRALETRSEIPSVSTGRRGRPRKVVVEPEQEPEPIKWWLNSPNWKD